MDEASKKIYEKYGLDPKKEERELRKIMRNTDKQLASLKRKELRNAFNAGMKVQFENLLPYLRYPRFYLFVEMESHIFQVIQCLINGSHSASITLTNHIAERAFKLALIQNQVGVTPKMSEWNAEYAKAKHYLGWDFSKTIDECEKLKLIESSQAKSFHELRKTIRNGFSHYDPKQILKDMKDTVDIVMPKQDGTTQKQGELNIKDIPFVHFHYVNRFAEDNALPYFDSVFNIILEFERVFKKRYWDAAQTKTVKK